MVDKSERKESTQSITVKKGDTYHGGAWKVAYADFVTAMMAFFLLLWLLNVSTQEELNAISNYFDPTHPKVSDASSGAGGVMGGLSMTPQGAMATTAQNITLPQPNKPTESTQAFKEGDAQDEVQSEEEASLEQAKEILREEEEDRFEETQKLIEQAISENPDLAALADNLIVDMTPEGLRIQIVDQEGKPMFASGSAKMYDKTRALMEKLTEVIEPLPNELSIRGHTDSVPYGPGANYTNWELSSDRANASRRVLLDSGLPAARLNNVVGKADTEHLEKDNPKSPRNRRISIVLLKEELTNPDFEKKAERIAGEQQKTKKKSSGAPARKGPPIGTFRKTPGAVQFP